MDLVNFVVYGYEISPDKYNRENVEDNVYYNIIDDDSEDIVSFREPKGHNFAVVGIAKVLENGMVDFTEFNKPSDTKIQEVINFIVDNHNISMNKLDDPSWYMFSYNT